ncbi:flagellar type III secretion system pore protein FliP [Vallicoccus soli]|uniref:Flagellar biosynthetic protein FliP n=1 Tax=Vallicoccus soli TaxID=2339232 RepID=A0A3A3YQ22_9ACTN|nr:flagellar type III secretion system pore protein FliP [Vallicoccus soli]RJK92803.1 flagellar biosynthetic protein FliP [Vallicoccus soli]
MSRHRTPLLRYAAAVLLALLGLLVAAPAASAAPADPAAVVLAAPQAPGAGAPAGPAAPAAPGLGLDSLKDLGPNGQPSTSITVLLAVTVLSVAPALLLMCTSFTKIVVVLGMTRNALGLQSTPPTQVLVGLALFLSLFVMAPVLSQVNELGVQPFLDGTLQQGPAFDAGVAPLREFMFAHTRPDELALISQAENGGRYANADAVPLTTLVPAFVLSELKSAFIIGFVIFIPFLVIDIVVSSALMGMGMMMLPPVMISLPFKLLLFVLVDGWGLIVTALLESYR